MTSERNEKHFKLTGVCDYEGWFFEALITSFCGTIEPCAISAVSAKRQYLDLAMWEGMSARNVPA
jgi:hypothetical protein